MKSTHHPHLIGEKERQIPIRAMNSRAGTVVADYTAPPQRETPREDEPVLAAAEPAMATPEPEVMAAPEPAAAAPEPASEPVDVHAYMHKQALEHHHSHNHRWVSLLPLHGRMN
jgi:hypothetical protein